jgi:hypothetical protein
MILNRGINKSLSMQDIRCNKAVSGRGLYS